MIRSEGALERNPGVALVVNVDGFGNQPVKVAKYREFTRDRRAAPRGGTASSSSTRRTRS